VLILAGAGFIWWRNATQQNQQVQSATNVDATERFDTLNIPLNELNNAGAIFVDASRTLSINGQLKVNNGFVIAPTGQPTGAVAGQIYYDQSSNALNYYNGSQFVPLLGQQNTVTSLGGGTGVIALGDGLTRNGSTLSNNGVLTVQGQAGNVTFAAGPGVVINGTTISSTGVQSFAGQSGDITIGTGLSVTGNQLNNTGVLSVASGSASLTVTNDGNGNVTITSNGAGTGTVQSPGGTANRLAKFTGAQTIADSLLSDDGTVVTVNGNLTVTGTTTLNTPLSVSNGGTGSTNALGARSNLGAAASGANSDITSITGLTTALSVSQGGTGAGTLATNGILLGNGTSPITSLVAGGAGQCLISTSGAPVWQACPGGSGVLSLNGLTGALTLANASAAGSTVTINDASTAQKGIVQFNGANFSVAGGVANTIQNIGTSATPTFAGINTNAITPTGALTVGATTQNATLQGAVTTITSTSGANTTTLTFVAPTANVTYRLQTAAAGTYDVCTTAGNCTGVGGGVTTPGGTTNTLAKFTGSQNIANSIITDDGTTVTVGGNLTVTGTTTFTTPLSVANGGTGTNTLATNGVIIGNGTGALTSVTAGAANLCLTSTAGAPAFSACDLQAAYNKATGGTTPEIKLNTAKGSFDIQDADTTIASNLFNVRSSNSAGFGQILFGVGNNGAITAQNAVNSTAAFVVANAAGTAQLTVDTTNSKVIIGTLQTNTITPSAALTVGATGQAFTMQGNASSTITATDSGNTTSLVFQTPTANVTYRLLTAVAGTFDICTTVGNCAGTGGGVTTPGGTAGKIAKFTAGQTIADSIISDNGSTVTIGGALSVNTITPTAALTVGATGQNLTLQGATVQLTSTAAGITNSLVFATPASSNKTITLPNISGTVCLDSGNCLGGGGGGANTSLSNLTAVAINTSLLPGAAGGINLGSGTLPFGDIYLAGTSGTPATNNFKITGASTSGTRTITLPDASGTVCLQSSASCGFAPATGGTGYIQNTTTLQTNASIAIQSAADSDITLRIRERNAQSVDVFRIEDSNGNYELRVDTFGSLHAANKATFDQAVGIGDNASGGEQLRISAATTSTVGLTVNGNSGQTANVIQVFTGGVGTPALAVSGSGQTSLQNTSNSTSAFTVNNAAGNNLLRLDTTNSALIVGNITSTVGAGVNGLIKLADGTNDNFAASLQLAGALSGNVNFQLPNGFTGNQVICISGNNCGYAPSTGGTGYIQNGTSMQTANYAIQSASAGSIAATIRGATSQTAAIFEVQNSLGNPLFSVAGNTNYITANDNLILNGQGSASDAVLTVKANSSQGGSNTLLDVQRNNGDSIARIAHDAGLYLGNSSGIAGSVNIASSTGNFAALNTASLSTTRTITIPNASGTICLDSGNCGSATGTLQSAYGFSTGGTTPEIKLDSTRQGIDVQDADTTLGSNANFMSYRASNGAGLGSIIFGWGIQGNYFQKPTVDSVTVYQVQTSAGGNLFTIDSTNGRVGINLGGSSNPSYTLEVKGDLNVGTGVYRSGGTAGLTATTCTSGQVMQNVVVNGGIVTGGACTTNGGTLQTAYNASTNPELVLNNTNGALTVRDASTPITGNLFEVQDNAGSTNYFAVSATGVWAGRPLTVKMTTDSTTALNVKTSLDNNTFTVDTINGRVGINLGSSNTPTLAHEGLELKGSLRISGGDSYADLFTTPVGTTVNTRINVPLYDPAAFGQVVAMGLASTAPSTARVLSLFDARASAHQPTIGVFSPNENDLVGFSWEGASTTAYLKTTGGNIALRSNSTDLMTLLSGGNVGVGVSPSYKFDVAGDVNTSTQYRIGGNVICTSSGCTPSAGSSSYIQNQSASDQTASLRISGTARVNTAVNTPVLDTATNTGLAIGNANATSISLGNTGANLLTAIYGQGLVKSTAGNNSATAFQIQSNTATVAFDVDTINLRVGVGGNIAPAYPLDVTGDINTTTALRIGGTSVCDTTGSTGCIAKSGSGFYIHNQITLQSANMFIQASDTSAPTAAFEQAATGTADVLDVFKNDGTTKYLSVSSGGNFAVANGSTYSLSSATSGSITSSGSITVTAGGASTWSTSSGNLTLQAAGTSQLNLQTGGAGTINMGVNNTTTINIGNSSNIARTISIGDTGAGSQAQTISIGNAGGTSTTTIKGGTGSTAINLTPASGGSINLTTTGGSANINITASGSIINKVSTDSSTAYQIQNSASASLFTVDTSLSNISILGNNSNVLSTWSTTTAMTVGSPNTRVRGGAVTANGYIYYLGGVDGNGTTVATVGYAKLNADGTVGTWNSTTSLPNAVRQFQPVVANGYIYVIGGRDNSNTTLATSYYAKINSDGTLGSWNTTTALSSGAQARFGQGTIAYNGYMYVLGGFNSSISAQGSVLYNKINADGTLGSTWNTTTSFSTGLANINGTTVANGYAYVVGGFDGSSGTDYVRRAKLNADGTMSSWTNQTGVVPGGGDENFLTFVSSGYLYVVGGDSGSRTSVFPLNADGSVGTAVSLTAFPVNMGEAGGAQANGYFYVLGGSSSADGAGTVRNTVYYASTSRLKVGGNLDLVNYGGENLSEGGTGGALTAGNTTIVGTLQVQDSAVFARGVTVGDTLTVGGTTTIKPGAASTSAFQVQNTSGTNQLSVDTTNSRVYVGPTAGDTTGSILVLGNKTNAGDPTGVAGAMYYNSSTNTFRCYENGGWTDCLARHKIVLGSDVATGGGTCASTNITGLSFSVTSGNTYRWHAMIAYSADATTTGSEWSATTPSNSLLTIASHQYTAGGAGVAATEVDQLVNASDAGQCSSASAFTNGNLATIDGVVTPSANGTVQMRFAAEVSGGTITAKAGSTLEWW
jgi:hypothetical protein